MRQNLEFQQNLEADKQMSLEVKEIREDIQRAQKEEQELHRHVSTNLGMYAGHQITLDELDSSTDEDGEAELKRAGTRSQLADKSKKQGLLGSALPKNQSHSNLHAAQQNQGDAQAIQRTKIADKMKTATASHVKTKNGYLFLRRNPTTHEKHPPTEAMTPANQKHASFDHRKPLVSGHPPQAHGSEASAKRTIRVKSQDRFYSRHKYFQGLPQSSLNQPCINAMCPYIGTEEQIKRIEDLEKKKYWVSSQDFKKFGGRGGGLFSKHFKDAHYVTADPSESPLLHQFRVAGADAVPNIHTIRQRT